MLIIVNSILLYNTAGFTSKISEEVATLIAKNCHCRQPYCHLTPPARGSPANIHIHLIFPETRVIVPRFCC